jgi:hypothetical protein
VSKDRGKKSRGESTEDRAARTGFGEEIGELNAGDRAEKKQNDVSSDRDLPHEASEQKMQPPIACHVRKPQFTKPADLSLSARS